MKYRTLITFAVLVAAALATGLAVGRATAPAGLPISRGCPDGSDLTAAIYGHMFTTDVRTRRQVPCDDPAHR